MTNKPTGKASVSPKPKEHDVPCKALHDLELDMATLSGDVSNFKSWQEAQNGSLQRIEDKVDKLMFRMIIGAGGLFSLLLGYILVEAIRAHL